MSAVLINQREIITAPFASQLDEIDKALFEYSYRKQTQQFNNNGQFHQSNNHHNNNNNKFGGLNNKGRNNHNYNYHSNGNNNHSFARNAAPASNNGNFNNMKTHRHIQGQGQAGQGQGPQQVASPLRVVSPQQQQIAYQNMMIQQPQPMAFNNLDERSNSKISVGSTGFGQFNNIIASSPESYIDDSISPVSKLSSSVTSSGTVSTSSGYDYHTNQSPMNNNSLSFNGLEKTNQVPNSNLLISGFNSTTNASNNNFNVGFNVNEFNNGGINHRSGWLNIWGNDMSVWG